MKHHVSATDLARRLGDILGRVRYRGEEFLIERHNVAIAQIGPPPGAKVARLLDIAKEWVGSAETDSQFADDLERIGAADRPPALQWDS